MEAIPVNKPKKSIFVSLLILIMQEICSHVNLRLASSFLSMMPPFPVLWMSKKQVTIKTSVDTPTPLGKVNMFLC
jgi:hypothetical protein